MLSVVALLAMSAPSDHTTVGLIATNDGKGPSNFFGYYRISTRHIPVREGDQLVYEVLFDPANPMPKGGIDVGFTDGRNNTRDLGLRDQNGLGTHGETAIPAASGRWIERRISLSRCAGRIANSYDLMMEGDAYGRYTMFIRDLAIQHANGVRDAVLRDFRGTPQTISASGYSDKPLFAELPANLIPSGGDLAPAIAYVERMGGRWRSISDLRETLRMSFGFAHLAGSPNEARLGSTVAHLDQVRPESPNYDATMKEAQGALRVAAPTNRQFVGHLIGHGHVDAQWLWERHGGLQAIHDTWAQAIRFMDEFPGFTFTQSSPAFYKGIEETFPELFAEVRKRVRDGHWEIVGGRTLEADENLIGSEAHARHFLLGQGYYRSRFGKTAVVGWEPDTFGHTAQFPQILRLGGCDFLYHYRAGRGEPLYRWQALDGSRILAFDEAACGGWYGNGLSTKQFERLQSYVERTGKRDMAWIYGVGNHGGGPTRRQIRTAKEWQAAVGTPTVRFSTAERFFRDVSRGGTEKLPIIKGELIGDAQGTFTSEAEVKRMNRSAESAMLTAEAVNTAASLFGKAYPKEELNRNWWDLLFQQHHDTICGSGNNASYDRTKLACARVQTSAEFLAREAMETLALRVTPEPGGASVLVFNPTGVPRSGWVEAIAPRGDEQNPNSPLDLRRTVAVSPGGQVSKFVATDPLTGRGRFWAGNVPPFGYAVFRLREGDPPETALATIKGDLMQNDHLRVTLDFERGCVTRVESPQGGIRIDSPQGIGRLIFRTESEGTTAWHIGKKLDERPLVPLRHEITLEPNAVKVTFIYSLETPGLPKTDRNEIRQAFRLATHSDRVETTLDIDWHALSHEGHTPGLRLAFDSGMPSASTAQQIPFGVMERPVDGSEQAVYGWADLSDGRQGLSVINNGAGGHSVRGGVLSVGVIRSPDYPNPRPNQGRHSVGFEIWAHAGNWRVSGASRAAAEMSQPMLAIGIPYDAKGPAPKEWSPLSVSGQGVVPTALKRSEDGRSIVLRFLLESGNPTPVRIASRLPLIKAYWANFLEDRLAPFKADEPVLPWQIRTLIVPVGETGKTPFIPR